MIASEGLNLGTALAHLQNLSREFETLEAASIKARTELDRLTRFLEQTTAANDECESSSAETYDIALASLAMTRADGAIADKTVELMTAAPAEAITSSICDDQPADDEPNTASVPGEDLETAFYRTVADLFASNQLEEGDKQTLTEVDALATELNSSAILDEATDAAASSLTTDTLADVLDDEPLFNLFAVQDEIPVHDEPADMAILEVNEPSSTDERDHLLDVLAEIDRPELGRGEAVKIDHDPQLFGFQDASLTTETGCTSDNAVSILASDEIDAGTAATESCQRESIVEHHDFDDIASLFDTLGDELDLAVDTTDFVGETV
ncbi:MAG: hypothetical protein ACR2OV_04700, partial [Hyphomicrobiaceae bacterium]